MHQILELAAVINPMPAPGSVRPDDFFDDACEQVEQQRKDYADNLEAVSFGMEADPLILALEQARAEKTAADARIRRLLAYAREFHASRRYPLHELAQASGYTNSGVRTAYTDEVVSLVKSQVNRDPRRAAETAADEEQL
ncbi:hypothetical protein SLUN_01460 [Streptomyces lunaelactis]|uniref:Uncharacterized protein n=1 Tax=Streptomyces lunaelactis TaxID=1535768 RepID=A0A2R4SW50_9ACTN|nr:hypothetical protein [Streptomyces lunaelactis]AVZ71113.1 hypothetical protein SLUN_01460 [Streptomyces lunaelactis]NUK22766.1 hypothetical protein [Streptomyces lunaelactis]NUK85026.1 hypothetical protein [Streptomyces lunaelactis]